MVLEVGYNLTYSWHKYSSDADCCLVLKVLMGMLPPFTAAAAVLYSVSRLKATVKGASHSSCMSQGQKQH